MPVVVVAEGEIPEPSAVLIFRRLRFRSRALNRRSKLATLLYLTPLFLLSCLVLGWGTYVQGQWLRAQLEHWVPPSG